jgi:hypothetical protein
MKQNNKIIFLDIDGPLAWGTWGDGRVICGDDVNIPYPWVMEDCQALYTILEKTDAKIVLSSDWRKHYSFKDMKEIMYHYGIPGNRLIDYTHISGLKVKMSSSLEMDRAAEIIQWLKANKVKKNWVAIDDLDLASGFNYFKYPKYRHVQVDGDFGYGGRLRDKVDDVIKILNK